MRRPSLVSEHELPQDETTSENGEQTGCGPNTIGHGTGVTKLPYELGGTSSKIHFEDIDMHEYSEESGEPGHTDLLKEDLHLQNELQRADEEHYHLHVEVQGLRADVDHLYSAWLKPCAAAVVTSEDVAHFHFLMTDSDVNTDSRAAAHQKLVANGLCRWIINSRKTIENLQLESKQKDEVIATYRGESAAKHNTLLDGAGSHHGSSNWRDITKRNNSGSSRSRRKNKRLRPEAERMYQPDLDHEYKECQASLIKVRDRNAILVEKKQKTGKEASSWQDEVKKHKEELARRSAHFDEQARFRLRRYWVL